MDTAKNIAWGLAEAIRDLPQDGRKLIALAGPPASGKSTIAAALVTHLGKTAALVPMDGFHYSNAILDARDLRARKGAPETFDLAGFNTLMWRLRTEDEVAVPTFDRTLDTSIGSSVLVEAHHSLIVVEGNYLLLDEPGWSDLNQHWNLSVGLDVPEDVLEKRLVQRWLSQGLSTQAARNRALSNDIPNAQRVLGNQLQSDLTI